MAIRMSIDVDLTIIDENENLLPGVVEGLKALKDKDYFLTLWSHGGEERARTIARKHHLCCFFDGYATKPDLLLDDDTEVLNGFPAIDVLDTKENPRGWKNLSRLSIQLAEELDNKSRLEDAPDWIRAMAENKFSAGVQSAMAIWHQRNTYIRWPKVSRLLMPGVIRHSDGSNPNCYAYSQELIEEIRGAGLLFRNYNNDPAIHSFLLAGGDRPRRLYPSTWAWTIHHIYDGKHPAPTNVTTQAVPWAVCKGDLFTHSAGLVAVHPLADYVATNEPLLAWLLRWEASKRFPGFDPMGIFN
jgi:hypothetical protein